MLPAVRIPLRRFTRYVALALLPLYTATFTVAILGHSDCVHHFALWAAETHATAASAHSAAAVVDPASAAVNAAAPLCRDPAVPERTDHEPCRCGDLSCHGAAAAAVPTPPAASPPRLPAAHKIPAYTSLQLAKAPHTLPFAHAPPARS